MGRFITWLLILGAVIWAAFHFLVPETFFAFVWTLFVFGSIGFWVLTGLAAILLFFFAGDKWAEENPALAAVVLLVFGLLLQFFGDIKVFSYVWHHPLVALSYLGGYLLVGVVYSILRWWAHASKTKELALQRIENARQNIIRFGRGDETENKRSLSGSVEETKEWLRYSLSPLGQWERIAVWIYCWPVSAILYFLDDPIRRLCRWTVRQLRHAYASISDFYLKKGIQEIDAAGELPLNQPVSGQYPGSRGDTHL